MKRLFKGLMDYFKKEELSLMVLSFLLITLSFVIFDRTHYLNLIASYVGVTSLIFISKANPIGQILVLVFSALYGIVSYKNSYYGEMITYLGMIAPMAILSFVSWIKHPSENSSKEVKINHLLGREYVFMIFLALSVTGVFFFILKSLDTNNLIPSTISVFTSFLAVYLTFRRSEFYALAYAMNDIVLIVLWLLASFLERSYISVVICFIVFFFNDLYGFINWRKMKKKQKNNEGENIFRKMRRFKQELTIEECLKILDKETCGVLSLMDNEYPYSVPLSYVYMENKIYFHSAKVGYKIDLMRKNNKACFCIIEKNDIVREEYTTYFRSIIAFGNVSVLEDIDEMKKVMIRLGSKTNPKDSDISIEHIINTEINHLSVIELEIIHLTGKEAIELVRMKK